MIKKADYYEDFKKVCESNNAMDHFRALFEKYRCDTDKSSEDHETRAAFNAGYEAGFNRGIISAIEMSDIDKNKAGQILSELFIKASGKDNE